VLRFLALAVVALLVFLLIRSVVSAFLAGLGGTRRRAGGSTHALRNDLVKDPVCETYVPRRTAIARAAGPTTYYFCSPACAAKFKAPT
jgi:YHS domain-containing protein